MVAKVNQFFKIHNASQFKESIDEVSNTIYYVTAGHRIKSPNIPPDVNLSVNGQVYDYYQNLIFGKKVNEDDVVHVTNRIDWERNKTYDHYDNEDTDLFNKNYYVVSPEGGNFHVFLCLNNGKKDDGTIAPSTEQPLASQFLANDEITRLDDDYQWKYLYTITNTQWNKFSTRKYIPILSNPDVQANAIPGAIDTIVIEDGGSNYNAYANGTFREVFVGGDTTRFSIQSDTSTIKNEDDFYTGSSIYILTGPGQGQIRTIERYSAREGIAERTIHINKPFDVSPTVNSRWEIMPNVKISGDGTGAVARATVKENANTISHVEILNRGINYTYAKATVVSNTGILIEGDIDSHEIADNARLRPIIPPPGGHGSNVINELNGDSIEISVEFKKTENGHISTANTSFEQIGIIKDVQFANTELTISGATGSFVDGNTVTNNNGATGIITSVSSSSIRLTNVKGIFTINEIIYSKNVSNADIEATVVSVNANAQRNNSNFDVFNQTIVLTINNTVGEFIKNEKLIAGIDGTETYVEGYIYTVSPTHLSVTNTRGIWNENSICRTESGAASAIITGISLPDLVPNSGIVFYQDNIVSVDRDDNQTEQIQRILKF